MIQLDCKERVVMQWKNVVKKVIVKRFPAFFKVILFETSNHVHDNMYVCTYLTSLQITCY